MWNKDPRRRYCIKYDNEKLAMVLAGIGRSVLHACTPVLRSVHVIHHDPPQHTQCEIVQTTAVATTDGRHRHHSRQ
jgi:hypothetical protein